MASYAREVYRLRYWIISGQNEVLIIDGSRAHSAVQRGRVPRVTLHHFGREVAVVFKLLLLKVGRLPSCLHWVDVSLEYSLLCLVTLVVRKARSNFFFL